MYAVLVKNNETSWDVIGLLDYGVIPAKSQIIDDALDSGMPITGMTTTQYRNDARTNAVWNGTSFSGGIPLSEDANNTDEFWNSVKQYSIICDNKIISNITINNDNPRSALYEAAFASEVTMVKVPEHQVVYLGETYGWNGAEFTNPE